MPKIPTGFLDSVIYLYRNRSDAEAGKNFGGTGFLVIMPSELFPDRGSYFYAVSNWHVVCKGGFSTIRINTHTGTDIFEFGPEEWHFLPAYDIAVIPMPLNAQSHKAAMVPVHAFVQKELFTADLLGVGNDVFMIGRFVDHDGGQTNRPAARFGNISVLPSPIQQPNRKKADSFCIDMHSRTGYSGSPVFVYRTTTADLPDYERKVEVEVGHYLGLLGIHWGQFPEFLKITEEEEREEAEAGVLIKEGKYVKGQSGMTCVLPAWTVLEVLTMPTLRQLRDEHGKRHYSGGPMTPDAEVEGAPPASDANATPRNRQSG
jgi:hypothetical protein